MLRLAAELGSQLRGGFRSATEAPALPEGDGVRSVVVCGMGGSGVAGDILLALFSGRLTVPVVVTKGYELPEFCGRDTLVVASSFSGNTEETLSAYAQAVARGCRVVAVSAGGELEKLADADGAPHVSLPSDVPMPRAALGFLAGAPLGIVHAMELVPSQADEVARVSAALDDLGASIGPGRPEAENPAKELASWIGTRTPLIWGSEGAAATAALRWKTQVNENAKGPAHHAVLPELDHNEIEGWGPGTGPGHVVLILRHGDEHPRMEPRIAATREVLEASGLEVREVRAPMAGIMGALFSLVMMGDMTTVYLAVRRGVDPLPVPILSAVKERLRR
jgi:glucose/mannose-6-phosphate isomerase